jgi:C-terminal processing protease CtpA/Prc
LKDGHTYFKLNGGSTIYPWYPARYFKDKHTYSPFVVRKYFDKELILTESGSAEYEILQQNIGYIFLSDFHESYLIREFPAIINHLINTSGIIIDIRQRRGGTPQNVAAVVSHFTQESINWPDFYLLDQPVDIDPIQPKTPFYSNPVVVLINGSTFSAGELCTEVLKQLPTVTAVGDTTGGGGVASSSYPPDALGEYILPSGKLIYIGTGYFERYDGQFFEWIGVPPDVRIVNTAEEIEKGIDRQLEYAIGFITENSIKN